MEPRDEWEPKDEHIVKKLLLVQGSARTLKVWTRWMRVVRMTRFTTTHATAEIFSEASFRT